MIGQLVDYLLTERDVDPNRVLYLTTEASALQTGDDSLVSTVLEVYEHHFLGTSFQHLEDTVYVVIDEIQKAAGWDETLKFYVDTCPELTFVVTGSVSTLIQEDASETLVGRVQRQTVVPFKFSDVARYHGELDEVEGRLESRELRESLAQSLYDDDSEEFETALNHALGSLSGVEPALRSRLDEYLVKGGYPGVLTHDPADALYRLDEDLQRVVTGDLTTTFSVGKPDTAFEILQYFAESTGSKVSINKISNETGASRQTVENYVDYLEQFFLVYRSPHYTGSAKPGRKQPMAYVDDVGHLNALRGVSPDATTASEDR
ncbi:MAG: ATP-binding protein, partial [Halobaculum sp.]